MSTIGSRIRQRRDELGLSQDELAKKLGYKSRSSINKIELDQRNLTQSKIKAIADALDITPAYIMGWDDLDEKSHFPVPSYAIPNPFTNRVPRVGSVACGTPILAVENVEAYDLTPESWHADFTLVCKGDSMAPKIQDGDLVALRCQPQVERGQIAVALIDGSEATLKRVYVYPDRIELRAINPDFDSLIFFGNEMGRVRIEGLVVGICRRIVS